MERDTNDKKASDIMPLTVSDNRKLAVYLLLSHPLSVVKRNADAMAPSGDPLTAATAVSDMINKTLKLNLATGSQDYKDLVNLLNQKALYKQGVDAQGKTTYTIDTTPKTIAVADGYSDSTGCPNSDQWAAIFNKLI